MRWFPGQEVAGTLVIATGSALAVWVPTWLTWAAVALMVVGSDWRGRAEETLLERSFGEAYREYCARTARFLPGIY